MRIGELARRTGVAPELLRAWETRYGLLSPTRTASGYRLYSADDERRVRLTQKHIAEGLAAAEAARMALADDALVQPAERDADPTGPNVRDAVDELTAATAAFDGIRAHELLDTLIGSFTIETVLRDFLLPYLHDLGESWAEGTLTVAQEHFATSLIEGRLLGLARDWDRGNGPRAVLACPSGERHTLGLVAFGLALRRHGWRITYLGADTPADEVVTAADALDPQVIVLAAISASTLATTTQRLAALNGHRRLLVGGPAASAPAAGRLGWAPLAADPVRAADEVAAAGAS